MTLKARVFILLLSLAVFHTGFTSNAYAQLSRGVMVSTHITPEDIDVLGAWRVNLVRYPVSAGEAASWVDEATYQNLIDASLAHLDSILPLFEKYGIKVIVELYTPPGGFTLVGKKVQHRLFSEAWTQQAFLATWFKIASRYASSTTVSGYDILNEPAEVKVAKKLMNWSKLALQAGLVIRSVDSSHHLIVEAPFGNPALLKKVKKLPLSGVIYSVHMYYPLTFQHQGLYGNRLGVSYPTKKLNKKHLLNSLKPVISYQKKNKVPIYIGEFSAIRWAPGNSAYLYLADVISIFELYGWHWTYHAFRESNPWSVEHTNDINDSAPSLTTTDREMLLRQYFALN